MRPGRRREHAWSPNAGEAASMNGKNRWAKLARLLDVTQLSATMVDA